MTIVSFHRRELFPQAISDHLMYRTVLTESGAAA